MISRSASQKLVVMINVKQDNNGAAIKYKRDANIHIHTALEFFGRPDLLDAQVIPTGAKSIVEDAQTRLSRVLNIAAIQIEDSAAKAAEVIEKSVKAAEERERRARTLDRRHQLSLIGKIAAIATILAVCAMLLFAGWRVLPLVTGEVQITYTEAYQSELATTQAELSRTRNELNAYKDAHPEGLSEQRLHELKGKNAAVK